MRYEWISPWGSVALGLRTAGDANAAPSLIANIVSQPCGLLRQGALHAFWSFSLVSLGWVGKLAGIRLPAGGTLYGKLDALVRGICPDLSDEQVMEILRKRLKVTRIIDMDEHGVHT